MHLLQVTDLSRGQSAWGFQVRCLNLEWMGVYWVFGWCGMSCTKDGGRCCPSVHVNLQMPVEISMRTQCDGGHQASDYD